MTHRRARSRVRPKRRGQRVASARYGRNGDESAMRRRWGWIISWRWSITSTGTAAIYDAITRNGNNRKPTRTSSTGWTTAKEKISTCRTGRGPDLTRSLCDISPGRRGRNTWCTSTIWVALCFRKTAYRSLQHPSSKTASTASSVTTIQHLPGAKSPQE